MKNKIWIGIAALLVVILAVLLVWKPFGGAAKVEPESQSAAESSAEQTAEKTEAAPSAEPGQTSVEKTEEEQETSEAVMLENEGDLEIIIPDDQESDGF